MRAPVRVTVSKKSAARMVSACERRNVAQLSEVRLGAGSMPASWRISQTVEATTVTPRTRSSPWMRRYPQELFPGLGVGPAPGWIGLCAVGRPVSGGRYGHDGRR
jgi:hypothetical protein